MEVTVHTNHRRKKAKHHRPSFSGDGAYSLRVYRQEAHRQERAQLRELLVHERFDDVPKKYPKNVLWNYW